MATGLTLRVGGGEREEPHIVHGERVPLHVCADASTAPHWRELLRAAVLEWDLTGEDGDSALDVTAAAVFDSAAPAPPDLPTDVVACVYVPACIFPRFWGQPLELSLSLRLEHGQARRAAQSASDTQLSVSAAASAVNVAASALCGEGLLLNTAVRVVPPLHAEVTHALVVDGALLVQLSLHAQAAHPLSLVLLSAHALLVREGMAMALMRLQAPAEQGVADAHGGAADAAPNVGAQPLPCELPAERGASLCLAFSAPLEPLPAPGRLRFADGRAAECEDEAEAEVAIVASDAPSATVCLEVAWAHAAASQLGTTAHSYRVALPLEPRHGPRAGTGAAVSAVAAPGGAAEAGGREAEAAAPCRAAPLRSDDSWLRVEASVRAPPTVAVGVPFSATVSVSSRAARHLDVTLRAPVPASERGVLRCGAGASDSCGAPGALCLCLSLCTPLGTLAPGARTSCAVRMVALGAGVVALPALQLELRAASFGPEPWPLGLRAEAAVLDTLAVRAGTVRATAGPERNEPQPGDGDGAGAAQTCWAWEASELPVAVL